MSKQGASSKESLPPLEMNPEGGPRVAERSAWSMHRRAMIALAACLGMPACVCQSNGVLRRGTLELCMEGFHVGGLPLYGYSVGALTIERDLVTVHVGDLA